jgi:CRISPR-associated protein Csh1
MPYAVAIAVPNKEVKRLIYDLLEYFKDNPRSNQLVIDQYTLKSGLYIRLNKDGTESMLVVKKREIPQGEPYDWFKKADYFSCITDTNKAFDAPKKVMHNNNYFTLFFKTKSLLEQGKLKDDFIDHVLVFYDKLIRKLDSKDVLDFSQKAGLVPVNEEAIIHNRDVILEKLPEIARKAVELELKDDDYVKLFFEEDMEAYQREYIRYYYPYIFNKNDFNIAHGGTIYGLSAANMGLNTKKPFLEHKTTNFKVPFRISLEDAMEAKKLFEWLSNQKDEGGKSINEGYIPLMDEALITLEDKITNKRNMHYVHVEKGTDTVIDDYDFLPGITDEIKKFEPINYLMLEYYDAPATSSRQKMEQMVDKYLYGFKLKRYYKTNPKDIKGLSHKLMNLLLLSRKAMEDFFIKGDDRAISHCVDRITLGLVKEKINEKETVFFHNTGCAINIRLALLKYFDIGGKKDMGDRVRQMFERLAGKVDSDDVAACENDSEFYFAAGQLVRYILLQSEAKELNHDMVDAFLNAAKVKRFKYELKGIYQKYNHALKLRSRRFNHLLSMVMGYDIEDHAQIDYDMFLAGLAAKNVMYMVKEENDHENEK